MANAKPLNFHSPSKDLIYRGCTTVKNILVTLGLLPLSVLFAAVANASSNNVKFQYFSDSIGTCFSMRLYIFVMSFVLIFNVVVSGGLYFSLLFDCYCFFYDILCRCSSCLLE